MLPEPTDPPLAVTRLDRETLRVAGLCTTSAVLLAVVALAAGARPVELGTLTAVMGAVTLAVGAGRRDLDDLLRRARPLPTAAAPARARLGRQAREAAVLAAAGAVLVAAVVLGEGGGYAGVAVGVLLARGAGAGAEHRRVVVRQRAEGVVLHVAPPPARGEPERAFVAPA